MLKSNARPLFSREFIGHFLSTSVFTTRKFLLCLLNFSVSAWRHYIIHRILILAYRIFNDNIKYYILESQVNVTKQASLAHICTIS